MWEEKEYLKKKLPLDTSKVKVITDSMFSALSAVPCYSYFLELFEQDIFNQNVVFKTSNLIKHARVK